MVSVVKSTLPLNQKGKVFSDQHNTNFHLFLEKKTRFKSLNTVIRN